MRTARGSSPAVPPARPDADRITTHLPRRAVDRGWDAVTLLTVLLVLRLALPSQWVVGPLGGAGSPATLLGLVLLTYWLWHRVHRVDPEPGAPVTVAAGLFLVVVLASYAGAASGPLSSDELNLSLLAVLGLMGWSGGLFLASDGVSSLARLRALLGRLAVLGGLFAAFGLVQFVTARAWVDEVSVPGLAINTPVYSITLREGFIRPFGTAIHPIEFGSVLAVLLPLAIVSGLLSTAGGWRRLLAWLPAATVLLAASLSSSRSTLIGVAVGMALILPALDRVQRVVFGLGAVALAGLVFVSVPGMVGTVVGLFQVGSGDPSVTSRVDSFSVAAEFLGRAPVLGRGFGTFLPRYRIFDNQYLLALVEIGVVGLVAMILLWAIPVAHLVRVIRDSPPSTPVRLMATGLLASSVAGGVGMAFFDGFGFPMLPGVWFVVLGLGGACYRLSRATSS